MHLEVIFSEVHDDISSILGYVRDKEWINELPKS